MKPNDHPWDKIYAKDGRVFSKLLPLFHEAVHKFSENSLRNILDLGCGNGRHLIAFRQLGFNVTGFDISQAGLNITQAWLTEENLTANLVAGDARSGLPFSSLSFDSLISTQVIHHALISEIRHTIAEIYRVLREESLAIITVAGKKHLEWQSREIEPGTYLPLNGPEKGLPHHIFTEAELLEEFNQFQVLDISQRDRGRVLAIWVKKV